MISFTFKSELYSFASLQKAIDELCPYLSIEAVKQRLNAHWTIQQALDLQVVPSNRTYNWLSEPVFVEIDGEMTQFPSYENLFAKVAPEMPQTTLKARVRKGWTLHEVVGLKARIKCCRPQGSRVYKTTVVTLLVDGVEQTFKTINDARKRLKVKLPREEIIDRLAMGWELEAAFGLKNEIPKAA